MPCLTLSVLQNATRQTVLQWNPAHCNIPGNEEVDRLAKEGGKLDQEDREVTYKEAKAIVYHKEKIWLKQHPSYNSEDNVYQLSREHQAIIVHLRTGHCRLRYYLHTKLHIGATDTCPCGSNDSGTPPARLYYTSK